MTIPEPQPVVVEGRYIVAVQISFYGGLPGRLDTDR
jgi:hypothetical protein